MPTLPKTVSKVKIIAEIGINFNGILDTAELLVIEAIACGVDYVKFQKRDIASHHYSEEYRKHRISLEFGEDEYSVINNLCWEKRVPWFASVWDLKSIDFVERFHVPIIKIPSAKITDFAMLERIAVGKISSVIISTGMSTQEQITNAYIRLRHKNLIIMHCNSSYPAAHEELNLNCIKTYKELYRDAIIGYSGHEKDLAPTLAAVALGAEYIERHITLDHTAKGSDHAASIEPTGFKRLVTDIRAIEASLGDGIKKVYPSETCAMNKLRYEKE